MARRVFDDKGNVTSILVDESDRKLIDALMQEPTIKDACDKAGINYNWGKDKARQLFSLGIVKNVCAIKGPAWKKVQWEDN